MRRIRRIADIINILMLSMCVACPAVGIIDIMTQTDAQVYIILLAGIFVINLLILIMRIKINKVTLFALGHIILCTLTIWTCITMKNTGPIGNVTGIQIFGCSIVLAVYSIIMFVIDIAFWMDAVNVEKNLPVTETGEPIKGFRPIFREGFTHISVFFAAVFVVMMFMAIYLDYSGYKMCAYVSGIVYIGLYLIRMYLKNVSGLIDVVEIGSGVTQKKLIKANTGIVIPFIALMILAMLLFQSEKAVALAEQLSIWILGGIFIVIFAILALFSGGGDDGGDAAADMYNAMDFTGGNNPKWLDMIYKIFEYLLTAALTALVLYLLVKLVIRLLNYYGMRSTNSVKKSNYEDMTEISERVSRDFVRKKRKNRLFSRMNNRDKVRYLYRKTVMKLSKSGFEIKKNYTPDELCSTDLNIGGGLVDITPTYCKARYSDEEITDNDVKGMYK